MVLAIIDVDELKRINDTCGHAAGDAALVAMTSVTTHAIRDFDAFGRLGGDEFGLVLTDVSQEEALATIERLRVTVADLTKIDACPLRVSISVGVAALQEVIAKNPELLTGGLGERRYLLIKKEMEVPDHANGSGRFSLDHLFVDDRGIPTLIEVKQASNREIRRMVVGQLLDYAANGMEYWPPGELRRSLVARLGDEDAANDEVAKLTADLAPDEFWGVVESNLRSGRVRLVVLADAIPKEAPASRGVPQRADARHRGAGHGGSAIRR